MNAKTQREQASAAKDAAGAEKLRVETALMPGRARSAAIKEISGANKLRMETAALSRA